MANDTDKQSEVRDKKVEVKGSRDNGVYKSTLANTILLGRHKILGGEKFTFTSDVLSNEIVKKRFERAVDIGLLVKV